VQFDPAIAAQASFARAQSAGELGEDLESAREAEAIFSGSAGREAREAYFTLVALGERRPDAGAFHEFLIYITWQQVTEETIAAHFRRGAELCDRYLGRLAPGHDALQADQIRELRQSFRAGLGLQDEDGMDYDADILKGGD